MTVPTFRAPMRSRRDDIAEGAAVERALAQRTCGVGGRLDRVPGTLDEAVLLTADQHDERMARRLERFAAAPDGAYVWTRDTDGALWLGRLAGPWEYDASPRALDVDLVHVRPCEWLAEPIPDAHAPASVIATFARGGRNWQETRHPEASEVSAQLWERYST